MALRMLLVLTIAQGAIGTSVQGESTLKETLRLNVKLRSALGILSYQAAAAQLGSGVVQEEKAEPPAAEKPRLTQARNTA